MKTTKIISGIDVGVKLEELPDHRSEILARSTLRALKRFFEIPGVQEDYEKWLEEYKRRKAV